VTGGYVYRGSKYQELYGKYFFTDYCQSHIRYLEKISGAYVHTDLGFLGGATSLVTWGEDRHGELYCAGNGKVYKLSSADCSPVATINVGSDTIVDCGAGSVNLDVPFDSAHTYLWLYNGTDTISGANSYVATLEGYYTISVSSDTCTSVDSVFVDIPPMNVSFTGLDTFYCVYNSSVFLTPNYSGGTFSGPGMVNNLFSPSQAGIGAHQITYTYSDSTGCAGNFTQNVTVDACLEIPFHNWTNSIEIFPNPSEGNFHITGYTPVKKEMEFSVRDISGRSVYAEKIIFNAGENKIPLNIRLAKGIYTAGFNDGISTSAIKLIIE
jgi:hypothetical protein